MVTHYAVVLERAGDNRPPHLERWRCDQDTYLKVLYLLGLAGKDERAARESV